MADAQTLEQLDDAALAARVCQLIGLAVVLVAGPIAVVSIVLLDRWLAGAVAAVGCLNGAAMFLSGRANRGDRAFFHVAVFATLPAIFGVATLDASAGWVAQCVFIVVVALLERPLRVRLFVAGVSVLHVLLVPTRVYWLGLSVEDSFVAFLGVPAMYLTLGAVLLVSKRRADLQRSMIEVQLNDIRAVMPALERVADGDLTGSIEGHGALPELTRQMQDNLAQLTTELRRNVEIVQSFAGMAGGNALAQQSRTDRMAEVVHDVRDHQQRVLEQARLSSSAAQRVAAASLESRSASADAKESLDALADAAKRVQTLHAAIKRLAAQSEVLAVNAAIEAHHAGNAGRAFATVAAKMQELSESIRNQLAVAEQLNLELAARATEALKASNRAAVSTLKSTQAADEIALHATDQLDATEQITDAFSEIEEFAHDIRRQTSETRTHAAQVVIAADDLTRQMDRFRT